MDVSDKWNGVYKLIDRKNAEAFMKKFGATSEKIAELTKIQIINELTIDGDSFCLKQRTGDEKAPVNVIASTLGKEDCFKTIDGLHLKGTITLDEKKDLRGKYADGIVEHMRFTAEKIVTDRGGRQTTMARYDMVIDTCNALTFDLSYSELIL